MGLVTAFAGSYKATNTSGSYQLLEDGTLRQFSARILSNRLRNVNPNNDDKAEITH
jgi:hypothetical protein